MADRWLAPVLFYFGLIFTAGFILGTLRELLLAPNIGASTAELIEIPVMLLIIVSSARLTVNRYPLKNLIQYLTLGVAALAVLLAAEITLVLWLRNMTLSTYIASKQNLAGLAYLLSLIFFALAPYLSARSRP